MLVLAEPVAGTIIVDAGRKKFAVTVASITGKDDAARIVLNEHLDDDPRGTNVRPVHLACGEMYKLHEQVEVRFEKVVNEKARIGVNAPKEWGIYRLEVYEAIRREQGGGGLTSLGAPVPRPPKSNPPSLDVKLDPPAADELA